MSRKKTGFMDKAKEEQNFEEFNSKQDIRVLEKFYVNAELDKLPQIVAQRENELENKIEDFRQKFIQTNYDKYGNASYIANPYLVSTYFFKPISPISSRNPDYSAERLGIVWNLYMEVVEQVNMYVTEFQPTLSHFAKFAGLTLNAIKGYKESPDEDMHFLMEKIYDECFNGNMSLAQSGKLKEKATITRMKMENDVTEQKAPSVSVNIGVSTKNLDDINKRVAEIKKLVNRTNKIKKEQGDLPYEQ